MAFRDFLPFQQAPTKNPSKTAQVLPLDDQKALAKVFKVAALAFGFNGLPNTVSARSNFEIPDVDLNYIRDAIHTDAYVRQAFNKYRELFWKEGWDIVGENEESVNYMWQRIDYMEVAMRRPFQDFLTDVADQLVKYGNVFIAKSRGDLQEFFPAKLYPPENKKPIVGYYMIPTTQVEILRDKNNNPRWYRQRVDEGLAFSSATRKGDPLWNAKEVIHLYLDKEPGRAFGSPFVTNCLDDVLSLRTMEEDILNLYHRELFPFYIYKVGTDEHPADRDEIEKAKIEIENLRVEGGMVTPHRHEISVLGAEGNALDFEAGLTHFKERVASGLGIFPHHLGMTSGSSGNRAMTDRLDSALYDKIKSYQKYFAENVRLQIFNELLMEGGYDPFVNPRLDGESDRCVFKFREIDIDTQIKKETHIINKVAQGVETIAEGRMELNMGPQMDESDTVAAMQVRLQPDQIVQTKRADGTPGQPKQVDTTPGPAMKPDAQKPSTGGKPNMKNLKKGPANIIRPQNQFGRRTSPNVRHDVDDNWLREVVELVDNIEEEEYED